MIIVGAPTYEGLMLRRVILSCDREVKPSADPSAPTTRIRLFVCDGARKDLLGEFNTARNRIDQMGTFRLSGVGDLDRMIVVGETVAVDAEQFGYGAPALKGFTVWPDWTYRGQ